MKQLCLVLFLKADPACGDQEILMWTMLRTVLGSLSGSPVSLFFKDHFANSLGGMWERSVDNLQKPQNSLLQISPEKNILDPEMQNNKLNQPWRDFILHLLKSSTAAAQTEFWHSWRTSPGDEQASVILSLASKQLSARLWSPRNNYWCKNSVAGKELTHNAL